MSNNSEESGPPTKKFKNDHDDENVWGEELDENTVEECLFLASQVLSEVICDLEIYQQLFNVNSEIFIHLNIFYYSSLAVIRVTE